MCPSVVGNAVAKVQAARQRRDGAESRPSRAA